MNKQKLAQTANSLKKALNRYADDNSSVYKLRTELEPFLDLAISEQLEEPLEWSEIPGGYLFSEFGLSKYRDLEKAYACFKIEATGGGDPILDKIREIKANLSTSS